MTDSVVDGTLVVVFWTSIAIVVHVYLGYPLSLLLFSRRRLRGRSESSYPRISILIAAYNEEREIGATIQNKLELDYPQDKLEIVVVSDGSADRTDEIARSFEPRGVIMLRQEPRQGKTAALNRARAESTGEMLLVSDANSRWDRLAARRLVEAFDDPSVGYATGTLMYLNPGDAPSAASCGAYMRYENWLRTLETRIGSIVGVNGGIDAVRRDLYQPMRADQIPDFILPLNVAEAGSRVIYVPAALAYEHALERSRDELRMRVRVSLRSLRALVEKRHLLSPRFGRLAYQLLVHKVLRYALFVPLVLALIANALLWRHPFYRVLLIAHIACYVGAILGWALEESRLGRLLKLPAFFLVTNVGAALAVAKLLRGERQVQWQPRKGA